MNIMISKFYSAVCRRFLAIVLTLGLLSASMPLRADAPMPPEQLDTLVAPIALYPDPLISQILVASTYPLELVQAGQWLGQHSDLKGQALKDAADQQSWDPSVQSLVLFPDVIKRLNADVTWTAQLGNAFLDNQSNVMDAIQRMRVKAEQAGKLKTTPQEKVTTTTQSGQAVIEIQPADPDLIYVPDYNPVWIWGPPVGYYYASWYYPPPPPFGVWCFWGAAFSMSFYYSGWIGYGGWGGWGWRPGWRDHAVIVNHTFFVHNHYSAVRTNIVHNNNVWVHNPEHRAGVAYPRGIGQRFNAPAVHQASERPTVSRVQQQIHQRSMSPALSSDRVGNRTVMPNSSTRSRSAFSGTQHGTNARVYSNRGRASMGRGVKNASPARGSGKGGGRGGR